ncbi:MAG: hypothetical protein PHI37_04100, partial [Candidatus Gracilibacteria bacterium]|nr:hypothetical protein [Candidatus Gracilibacteria bacterium]
MSNENVNDSDDELKPKACETVEEAVASNAFRVVFLKCLKEFEKVNFDYYSKILDNVLNGQDVTIEEGVDLMNLLDDDSFQKIYEDYFDNKITFNGNNGLLSKFKENISIKSIKDYFKNLLSKKIILDNIESIKEQARKVLKVLGVKILEVGKLKIIVYKIIGKGKVLLDENGKQISPEGKYYDNIYFDYFEETGLIIADEKGKGEVLLNKNGKQVSPEGKYYDYFNFDYFEKTGLILADEKGNGGILLDKNGKQISPEGKYYGNFNFNYFAETGMIVSSEKGNGGILLDKNGKQISPEGKYYGNFNFNYFAETGMIVSSEK